MKLLKSHPVQAVDYIGARSHTEDHEHATNQLPESNSQLDVILGGYND